MSVLERIPIRKWDGVQPAFERGRFVARLECASCGAVETITSTSLRDPRQISADFRARGWESGKRPACPNCIKARREKITVKASPATVTPIKASNEAPEGGNAKRNERLVIAALEDYFDEKAHTYRNGKSDKLIADELSLSVDFVVTVRETWFGKLGEPDEVSALRAELEKVRAAIETVQKTIDLAWESGDAVSSKLDALALRNGWRR